MYDIKKELWHTCQICKQTISQLASKYGGGGTYYTNVFLKHLELDHNISVENYFEDICHLNRPTCECGQCNKSVDIKCSRGPFAWKKYKCGLNQGVKTWSKKAKIERTGSGNPMFGKEAWNSGLSKNTSEIMSTVSKKLIGRKISSSSKEKMSKSAQKRTIHGHSGRKHSEKSKIKMRESTLKMIQSGQFKHTKTKPHKELINILNELNISFQEECRLSYWSFDFYIPSINYYIEVDGDYFHSNPIIYPNGPKTTTQKINYSRDLKKNKFCIDNNINLCRFWESDILNNREKIVCKLNELLALNQLANDQH